MKLSFTILFATMFSVANVLAQVYPIGSRSIALTDPSRSNRSIACEVYYPAATAGSNTPVANGQFPVIVLGHGFSMSVAAYDNWWTEFVPEGYIFILPTTEVGPIPFPSHPDFGLDLAFAASEVQNWNSDQNSAFYNKVLPRTALVGHSMGGGCSILAAENNPMIDCILGLAPAETNTSAISAAGNVNAPTMILWGTEDQVTPEADHALAIYNGLASNCKTYVRVEQGAHCFFANYNFFCAAGETSIGSLSREDQQATSYLLARPFFEYFLKDDCTAYDQWMDALATTPNLASNIIGCPNAAPVIVDNNGTLQSDQQPNYQWFLNGSPIQNADQQNFSYSQSGTYQVGTLNVGNCYAYSNEIVVQITVVHLANQPKLISVSDGMVIIESEGDSQDFKIEWFDVSGRLLSFSSETEMVGLQRMGISIPEFSGMKLLRITNEGSISSWKLF